MRFIYLVGILCVLVWLGDASPLNPKRRLINRPSDDDIFELSRLKRYANENLNVKGRKQPSNQRPLQAMDLNVRKGEYVCGNRICKLKAGEVPKGCNGICQHPV